MLRIKTQILSTLPIFFLQWGNLTFQKFIGKKIRYTPCQFVTSCPWVIKKKKKKATCLHLNGGKFEHMHYELENSSCHPERRGA